MNRQTDPTKLRQLQNRIRARKGLIGCGEEFSVALHESGRIAYAGSDRWQQKEAQTWTQVVRVVCGPDYIVGLLADGSLRHSGRLSLDGWIGSLSHIRSVSCNGSCVAVLMGNGRAAAAGIKGAAELKEWPAVTDVVCGRHFVAGLTESGRVRICGGSRPLRYLVSTWENIAGLFTDTEGTTLYAITAEGELRASRPRSIRGENWKNLVFMAADGTHIWGVTAAGKLVSTHPTDGISDDQSHYVACAVSGDHVLALTKSGQVRAWGQDDYGQCRTQAFGVLFADFDEFNTERHGKDTRMETVEKEYQSRLTEAVRYRSRLVCAEHFTACINADGRVLASTGFARIMNWGRVRSLACGNAHLLALHEDGRVSADGNQTDGCLDVTAWTNIRAIAAGRYHSLGLTEDGRVLFCGRNDCGQGNVTEWTGVRLLRAANTYTVGVTHDGRILIAGTPPFSSSTVDGRWEKPVDIAVSSTHMAALYPDGRVLSTVQVPAGNRPGEGDAWDTCSWDGIRSIAVGEGFTVGLSYSGRVFAVGPSCQGQCETARWQDIVEIGCGKSYVMGLCADGSIRMAGQFTPELGSLRPRWKDILTFSCGPHHAVGLTRSGQVVSCGLDTNRQCSATTYFVLFRDIRQLYGYGQYSQRLEQELQNHRAGAAGRRKNGEAAIGLLPFSEVGPLLRRDAESLAARVVGSDSHLTVLTEKQTAVTFVYATAETVVDTPTESPIRHMSASPDSTVLFFENGRARERRSDNFGAPPSPLPSRLGDSHFYPVLDMVFGDRHSVVLLRDGTLRAFGENDAGQIDVTSWSAICAIAAGDTHTVALRENGTVLAAGNRRRDVAGRTRGVAHSPRANPCAVEDWTNVARVVCTQSITVGLCRDGTVRATGSSHYGQCDTSAWRDVVSVATSGRHTVALFADGHVEAVGLNEHGECRTENWSRIIQIAVLPELTLGLRADGKILAAGRYHSVITELDSVRSIACFGERRQVFIMADGTLRIHMRGSEYRPEPLRDIRVFIPSPALSVLTRVTPTLGAAEAARDVADTFAVGMAHTVTLKAGAVHTEGANDCGQCDLRAVGEALRVAAGPYHSAAVLLDGTLALAGQNTDGQADADALNRELDPLSAATGETQEGRGQGTSQRLYSWERVACGFAHTAAIRSDGRVYAVGANPDGRCDTRQWRDVTHLACGMRHTLAVTADGSCVATGDNGYGQCDVADWQDVIMVAAGEFHSVGLRADGRVAAAGDNRKGQCRVEDLRDVISVACLPEATLCVHADGRVTLRGGSTEHSEAVAALREVIALRTCEHRLAALTADRRLILI